MYFRKIVGPRPLCLMLIKFSAYHARQSSVFFSFIRNKLQNTDKYGRIRDPYWLEALLSLSFLELIPYSRESPYTRTRPLHKSVRMRSSTLYSGSRSHGLGARLPAQRCTRLSFQRVILAFRLSDVANRDQSNTHCQTCNDLQLMHTNKSTNQL